MNKLAALAFIVASSSVALAQGTPAPAPAPAPAPGPVVVVSPAPVVVTQPAPAGPATAPVEDPSNVNTLNGQLVPVGQENDYLKKYKRWNVSTNPLGWVLGSYGVSVSYGLNQNIAIRGDVNYYKPVGADNASGVELGVGLPIYFRRTYQGLFLEPGIISRTFKDSYSCDGCSSAGETTNTTFGPQVLVGWHWTWSSGLNFAIAAGAGRNWSAKDTEYGSDEVFANGYMRFGYAFN
ncbi:MAG: DUF3575 domain-containing protein [Myxococcales bacterium]|nr:DUF3575 domain-containing protein [Myxococcales bacterium]